MIFIKAGESIVMNWMLYKLVSVVLDHLREIDNISDVNLMQWRKKRMDRMLVEHFLRGGYYNTAVKLATYSNIEVRLFRYVSVFIHWAITFMS